MDLGCNESVPSFDTDFRTPKLGRWKRARHFVWKILSPDALARRTEIPKSADRTLVTTDGTLQAIPIVKNFYGSGMVDQ
jgi:hypothetical protein